MLDDFLKSANEISIVLLPILGVIVLIALIVLLVKIIKFINTLPTTMGKVNNTIDTTNELVSTIPTTIAKVNDTIDTTHESIQKLEAPLDTIVGVSHTVDAVNKSATGIVSSIATYAIKNSDSLMHWSKDLFKKDTTDEEDTDEEEDFGVYE